MGKLTDTQLRAWVRAGKPLAGKSDGGGLTFTLSKAGTAAWVLRYRHNGRVRECSIGRYPDTGLADARVMASELRGRIQKGEDVAVARQVEKAQKAFNAATFRDLAADWTERTLNTRYGARVGGCSSCTSIPILAACPPRKSGPCISTASCAARPRPRRPQRTTCCTTSSGCLHMPASGTSSHRTRPPTSTHRMPAVRSPPAPGRCPWRKSGRSWPPARPARRWAGTTSWLFGYCSCWACARGNWSVRPGKNSTWRPAYGAFQGRAPRPGRPSPSPYRRSRWNGAGNCTSVPPVHPGYFRHADWAVGDWAYVPGHP